MMGWTQTKYLFLTAFLMQFLLACGGGSGEGTPTEDGDLVSNLGLATEFTSVDLGVEFELDFAASGVEFDFENEVAQIKTTPDDSSPNQLNLTQEVNSRYRSYEVETVINSQGGTTVSSEWAEGIEDSSDVLAGSLVGNTLSFSLPETIDLEDNNTIAIVSPAITVDFMGSGGNYFASLATQERVYTVNNNQPNYQQLLRVEAETRFISWIEKPQNFTASDLDGTTFGFVGRMLAAGMGGEFNGLFSGVAYGKSSFTDQEVLDELLVVSGIEVEGNGRVSQLLEFEDDSDIQPRSYTASSSGEINETETIRFVSKDKMVMASIYNNSTQSFPSSEGFISNQIGVLLDTNVDADILNGQSFDLIAQWQYQGGSDTTGSGFAGIVDFSNLTLTIDNTGSAALDGLGQDRGTEFPSNNITAENFEDDDGPFEIISSTNGEIFSGEITVATDGFFSTTLNTPPEWIHPIEVRGYVQHGGELVVGIMTSIIEYNGQKEGMDTVMFVGVIAD